MDQVDPGELSMSVDDMAPLDPRQLIDERHEKAVAIAARQVKDSEKSRRRKKNKNARRSRKNNR